MLKSQSNHKTNVIHVPIRDYKMIGLIIEGKERVCLSQISNTLLSGYSYNEIHNRRVALGNIDSKPHIHSLKIKALD